MSGKEGVVNKNGRLIIDTIYTWIHSFPNGLYIVGEPVYDTVGEQARGGYSGVMDSVGDFIVPFGKYKEIRSTDGRYFVAAYSSKPAVSEDLPDLYKYDILNAKGKTLFTLDYGDVYLADDIRGDLLRVRLLDTGGKPEEWYRKVYYGFMNLKGERVIDDRRYKNAGEFYHNRLVVQDSANNTWLIDTNGKKITENIFEDIEGEHFKNGFAYAKENGKWGVIDTLGKFVVSPQFQRIYPWSVSEDCFFFSKNMGEDNEGLSTELTGICGTNGKIILDAVMQHFDYNGFRNGLIKCKINDSEIYIDKTGNIIWQENPRDTTGTIVLNIDFMRSNMDATIGFDERSGYQGFKSYQTGGLVVHVNPDLEGKTFDGFAGYTCFVANNRNEAVWFNTSMGTLRLIMQAIDKNGEWKDIECFNGSFCGNAYYSIKLNSRHYWQIIVPKYAGSIKTKLRMKLTYIDGKPKSDFGSYADKTLVVYSNEFDGAVNPAQFWRVQFDRFNLNANIPLDK